MKSCLRYRALFEHAATGMAQVDINGVFIDVNPAYCQIAGYSREELIGKSFREITYDADKEFNQNHFEQSISENITSYTIEKRYIRKDGTPIWTLLTANLVVDEESNQRYFVSTIVDITSRKQIEEELQKFNLDLEQIVARKTQKLANAVENLGEEIKQRTQVESELRRRDAEMAMIMDGVPAAIVYVDRDRQCRFFNETFLMWLGLQKFGVDLGQALGTMVGEDVLSVLEVPLNASFAGQVQHFDTSLPFVTRERHVNISAIPDAGEAGVVRGVILFMTDITPRVEQLALLEAAKKAADQANAAKTEFLAHMSHEMRTPISVIIGCIEMLKDKIMDAQSTKWLSTIHSNAELLAKLVNSNLDLSKAESGKVDLKITEFNLIDCIRDVTLGLSVKAKEKNLSLSVHYAGGIPQQIRSDALRFKQILMNLLSNAIKFTPRGRINIDVKMENEPTGGTRYIVILVKDPGIGIPADEIQNLFKPYSQVHGNDSGDFGGTGLGLCLAKKIAQSLGGDVTLVSTELGLGSVFMAKIAIQ